jgi:voltage-gated potassium channel Kch
MKNTTSGESQARFRDKFSYWFDATMARGTVALVGWLALISLALIIVATAILLLLATFNLVPAGENGGPLDPLSAFWVTFLHAFSAERLGADTGEWPFLLLMLCITLAGIFVLSSLIGILTNGIEARLDELRRGRSKVLETGHVVVLGWSDQVFPIVKQFDLANVNRHKQSQARVLNNMQVRPASQPPIVILGHQDKVEMEEALRTKVGLHPQTRIVCRSGDPTDPDDLRIVNPQGARSIVVLPRMAANPDTEVIKALLALSSNSRLHESNYHIVAPIQDEENFEAAHLAGGPEAQVVEVGDTASRLIAQTCRQSGLSVIYDALLDFRGESIYFKEEPSLVGKPFGEALLAYEDASIIGLQKADGPLKLNPPMNAPIDRGDKLIAISGSQAAIQVSVAGVPPIDGEALQEASALSHPPERILLLGWNSTAVNVIKYLDQYVAPGSTMTVLNDIPETERVIATRCPKLSNLQITIRQGNTTSRRTLQETGPTEYDHVIVLAYSDTMDPKQADAYTLVTLLHLRQIKAGDNAPFSIVSEMLDDRNRELGEVAEVDDFIVSGKLFSLLMAQLAENKYLAPVYEDLLSPVGSEFYLKPAAKYIKTDRPVNFYTVVASARMRGEIAIGYKKGVEAYNPELSYGIVMNPRKSDLVSFEKRDRIILLSEG